MTSKPIIHDPSIYDETDQHITAGAAPPTLPEEPKRFMPDGKLFEGIGQPLYVLSHDYDILRAAFERVREENDRRDGLIRKMSEAGDVMAEANDQVRRERDQQERFKWAANERAVAALDEIEQAEQSAARLQRELEAAITKQSEVRSLYDELLMAVAKKFPDESRHNTALRYIREREHAGDNTPKSAQSKGGEGVRGLR